ncbi:Protein FAM48A [Cricetulus griseus]|uniref:Protein FAM48A n=1 Tax=Cricetulus griseus TaxID=10029 RepID=G3IAM2_CRIGR|nr:Protein FAM48A [Cricetulus griseus]
MNTRPMKRCLKRYSRSSLNRQQDLSHCPPPPQLRLLDFLQKRKERKAGQHYDLKISKAGNCVDMWKRSPCNLAVPSEVDVEKYAKVEKSIKSDDSQPTVWPAHDVKDDYVFECEGGTQYQKTKLTILQSLGDPLYYGKIQPWKADEENDSQMSPSQVVNQYQELVQNEAKCPVKMSHSSSGSASLNPGEETEFAQQQRALSQAMPVTSIPLSTMVTSITTGSTVSPVMADSAGLNAISVVSSAGGAPALKSGSNSMLGCDTGTITPAGKSLCSSGLLPSGGLLTNALPGAMQVTSQSAVEILATSDGYGSSRRTNSPATSSPTFRWPVKE